MSLIKSTDTWALWGVLVVWASVSIYLEQRYTWASKISGAIIALLGTLILANLRIIPTESPVYDAVWTYIVPLAVPLLLFKADLRKIVKQSGRTFLAFNISALGTVIGAFTASILLAKFIPNAANAGAMMTGSYIGGGVNFVAMASAFKSPKNTINSLIVADNLNMAVYFMVLIMIPTLNFFKKHYKHPYEDKIANELKSKEKSGDIEGNTKAAAYWEKKEISLLDIAEAIGTTFAIVVISVEFCKFINASSAPKMVKAIFGQEYLIITTFTMILATAFPKFIGEINGAQEIGTFLIYIFFVVIGAPANLKVILQNCPMLFVFCALIVIINMLVTFALGKPLHLSVEELCVASDANIGGPTTAAAMAISKGWDDLVLPALLVGVWGYVIGNYLGLFTGNILGRIIGM